MQITGPFNHGQTKPASHFLRFAATRETLKHFLFFVIRNAGAAIRDQQCPVFFQADVDTAFSGRKLYRIVDKVPDHDR